MQITLNNIKKRGGFSNPKKQSGYILIVSVILLGVMLIATLNFFEQSADSIQMSGYSRDSSEALLLAESAMNMLYGTFKFDGDIDGDENIDRSEGFSLQDPSPLPLPYMYFRSDLDTIGITATQPSILQRIADGEARSGTTKTAVNIANNVVPELAQHLLINELFNTNTRPVLFTLNETNQLDFITDKTWAETINENDKAAVAWLELTRPTENGPVEIYVQAAAKVGRSINYVQKFVGTFSNTLGLVTNLSESSPGP